VTVPGRARRSLLLFSILAASLSGCGGIAVYTPDQTPSERCALVAPVKHSLTIPADSPDRNAPLADLRARVLESCKEKVRDAGANALLITHRKEAESADRKTLTVSCSGMAYSCP
jgi:hypothetical protein